VAESAKILIVDDVPFNVDMLEQELEDLGYETITATNGQEALDQVKAESPDIVLLDVMMPVMDGFTACRLLKEDDDTRFIPVLIMTALDQVEDRIKGIEAGARRLPHQAA
jgi:CheY-like chemotaxis protein